MVNSRDPEISDQIRRAARELVDSFQGNLPDNTALFQKLIELRKKPDHVVLAAADILFNAFEHCTESLLLDSILGLTMGRLLRLDEESFSKMAPFASHRSDAVRARFCHAMGYAEDPAVRLGFGEQVKLLATDESVDVRRRAIQALVRLSRHGLEGTEAILENAKQDVDPEVRKYSEGHFN